MKYLLLGLLLLAACATTTVVENTETNVLPREVPDTMMEQKEDEQMQQAAPEELRQEQVMEEAPAMAVEMAGPTYEPITQAAYETALAEGKTVLLFFYANWCPLCRAEEPRLEEGIAEFEGLAAFRVNYKDSETDDFEESLAREFGVSYQHTKVILQDGQRILKSPESWSASQYMSELSKVI